MLVRFDSTFFEPTQAALDRGKDVWDSYFAPLNDLGQKPEQSNGYLDSQELQLSFLKLENPPRLLGENFCELFDRMFNHNHRNVFILESKAYPLGSGPTRC